MVFTSLPHPRGYVLNHVCVKAFRPAEAGSDVLVGDVNEDRARTSAAVIAQRFEVRAAGVGMDASTLSQSARVSCHGGAWGRKAYSSQPRWIKSR